MRWHNLGDIHLLQTLQRIHIVKHVTIGRCDHVGSEARNHIAREEDARFFQVITEVIEAMTGRMDGAQAVLTRRKLCAIRDFYISHRHPLATVGIDRNLQPGAQSFGPSNVIRVPMRDEDAPDTAASLSLLYKRIKVRVLINGRIDDKRAV